MEATIEDIHAVLKAGTLSMRQLVRIYLDRIAAYDKTGPAINAVISINPAALEEADRLDAAFKSEGLVGPLHGIAIIQKDQADLKHMPTTLGSILFKDYVPVLRRGQTKGSRRDFHRQGHIWRAWRRRHPRIVVRINP